MIRSLPQDLAFSARTLLRRPGFALLAILTVALGIGMNTAMFTIVNGVLWKPLPYPDSERLVMFNEASASGQLNCSYPNLEDWRQRSRLFEDIAMAREFPPATLRLEGSVESVPTGYAQPNLFSILGVRPVLGTPVHRRRRQRRRGACGGHHASRLGALLRERPLGDRASHTGAHLIF